MNAAIYARKSMECCKACLSPLPDSKERRSLVNPKSHVVINGLIQLSSKIEEDTSNCNLTVF